MAGTTAAENAAAAEEIFAAWHRPPEVMAFAKASTPHVRHMHIKRQVSKCWTTLTDRSWLDGRTLQALERDVSRF